MPAVFLNPLMLAALAAVAIPLIIELLYRRRRRVLYFPAMRYLLKAAQQKKSKLQDLLLLLLRSIVVFILVLAIARPVLKAGSALWAGGGNHDVILVLDSTYSMGQRVGATTAFETGKKMAAQALKAMTRNPHITVITLGHKAEVLLERSSDMTEITGRLDALRASDGAASIGDALELVSEVIEHNAIPATEIYVVSDLQKSTWSKRAGDRSDPAAVLAKLAAKGPLYMLDAGGSERPNYYLTQFEPVERVLAVGCESIFKVQVKGVGLGADSGLVKLVLYVNGEKRSEREVQLAGGEANIELKHTFTEDGEYCLRAAVDGDSLSVDNSRYYLCRVPKAQKVLIFDENSEGPPDQRASNFLSRAIAPEPWPGFDKFTIFESRVRRPGDMAREDLGGYAVVVLAGLKDLSPPFVARLNQYVREGGRLLVLPGEGVESFTYNSKLFLDGKGILPAKMGDPTGTVGKDEGLLFALTPPLHPALAYFKGRANLDDSSVMRYVPLEAKSAGEGASETLMQLSNGKPAFIERKMGRGLTLLACTSFDGRWSNLPFSKDFPVLIQELLRHLIGDPDATANLTIGGTFQQTVLLSSQHLIVVGPDGNKTRVTPLKTDGSQEMSISFSGTERQGLYRVDTIPEAMDRRQFVVNLVPEESDLARYDRAGFINRFQVGGVDVLDSTAQVQRVVEGLHSQKELSTGLLWTLFVLLFLETYLAKRFGMRRI